MPTTPPETTVFTDADYQILSVCRSCHRPIARGQRRHILHDPQRLILIGWHVSCPVPSIAKKYVKIYGSQELKDQFLKRGSNGSEVQQAVPHPAPEEAAKDPK